MILHKLKTFYTYIILVGALTCTAQNKVFNNIKEAKKPTL